MQNYKHLDRFAEMYNKQGLNGKYSPEGFEEHSRAIQCQNMETMKKAT